LEEENRIKDERIDALESEIHILREMQEESNRLLKTLMEREGNRERNGIEGKKSKTRLGVTVI
jgi:hypothetical protein